MSIEAIARVLNLEMDDPSAKLVLIGVANHTSPTNQCFPSVGLLMRYSGLSERTVREKIKQLEQQDYLVVHRRTGTSSVYHLNLDFISAVQSSQGGGADSAGGEVQQSHPNRNSNRKSNASDARATLPDDWQPADKSATVTAYPGIDVDHQVALFIAKQNEKGEILRDPEAAFRTWMLRTKDLKVPPRAAAPPAGPRPSADPAVRASALEANANALRDRREWEKAWDAAMNAAAAFDKIDGHDEDARQSTQLALDIARNGKLGWHKEQTEAWITRRWGDTWSSKPQSES